MNQQTQQGAPEGLNEEDRDRVQTYLAMALGGREVDEEHNLIQVSKKVADMIGLGHKTQQVLKTIRTLADSDPHYEIRQGQDGEEVIVQHIIEQEEPPQPASPPKTIKKRVRSSHRSAPPMTHAAHVAQAMEDKEK